MGFELTRREFLKATGAAAAGAAIVAPASAEAAGDQIYPSKTVGKGKGLQVNSPQQFTYPDAASPCTAVKLGKAGARRGGSRRRHRRLQQPVHAHGMPGQPTTPRPRTFKCGCHFSMFDAEKDGQMICGQATENLPRDSASSATTKDEHRHRRRGDGLIYGRQANVL